MPEFVLLPGARALDLEGGGSIRADRRGRVRVDDETAARIRESSAMHRYDAIVEAHPGGRPVGRRSDRLCGRCRRTAFDWEATCARCGAALEDQASR